MLKSSLKKEVIRLRKKGYSLNEVADRVLASKSTIKRWTSNIRLNEKQIKRLLNKKRKGLKLGRMAGAVVKKQKRLDKIENYKLEGEKKFNEISNEEFFVAGLFTYLSRGSKRSVSFTNSDPILIKFMIKWFKTFFNILPDRFIFTILSNKRKISNKRKSSKKNKTNNTEARVIKKFWSKEFGFPVKQFRIVKSKHERAIFRISKSTDLFYRILGLAYGFFKSYKLSRL